MGIIAGLMKNEHFVMNCIINIINKTINVL
jgi:hypothetical protein